MRGLDDSVPIDLVVCSRRGSPGHTYPRVIRNSRRYWVLALLPILTASCLGSLSSSGGKAPGSGPATEIRELLGASGDRVFLLTVEGSHLQAVTVDTVASGIVQSFPLPDGTEWSSVAYDQERNEMWYAASQTVSSLDIRTGVVSKRLKVTFPVNRILFFASSIVITDATCHYVLMSRADNRLLKSYDCDGKIGFLSATENLFSFSHIDDPGIEIVDPNDGHSWFTSIDHEKSLSPVTLDSRLEGSVLLTLGEPGGYTWAIEEETGKILWRFKIGADRRTVVIGSLLLARSILDDPTLWCLSAKDGKEQWRSSFTPASNPVPYFRNILVASDVTTLYCLDPASGREVWRVEAPPSSLQSRDDESFLYAGEKYAVILSMRDWTIVDLREKKMTAWGTWPGDQRFFGSFPGTTLRSNDDVIALIKEVRGAKGIQTALISFSLDAGKKKWELPANKLGQ